MADWKVNKSLVKLRGLDVVFSVAICYFLRAGALCVGTNFGTRSSYGNSVSTPLSYDSISGMEIYCGPFNVGVCNFIK